MSSSPRDQEIILSFFLFPCITPTSIPPPSLPSSNALVVGTHSKKEMADDKPQQAWKIHVHVKEKVISVSCGSAEQRIKWLGHVGIARWDSENNQGWTKLGQ
jgi:hypothetical protein